jgi:hypothetical protein
VKEVQEEGGQGSEGSEQEVAPGAREYIWPIIFLPKDRSAGLSGNWRGFSIDHR